MAKELKYPKFLTMQTENPQAPKSVKEIYFCCFFDSKRLKKFEKDRNFKQRLKDWKGFWMPMFSHNLICIVLWLVLSAVIVAIIPQEKLEEELRVVWSSDYFSNYLAWLSFSVNGFLGGFVLGFYYGLTGGFVLGLSYGVPLSLSLGLTYGLTFSLLFILSLGVMFGMILYLILE